MQQSEPESDYFTRIGKERRIAACAQPLAPERTRRALMRSPVCARDNAYGRFRTRLCFTL